MGTIGADTFLQFLGQLAEAVRLVAIAVVTNVVGAWLLLSGGWRMFQRSALPHGPVNDRGLRTGAIAMRLIVGTFFMSASSWLNTVALTVTGSDVPASQNAMSVMPAPGNGVAGLAFRVALAWAFVLGIVAILRGTMLLVKASETESGSSPTETDPKVTALIFMVAGAIGANLWRWV